MEDRVAYSRAVSKQQIPLALKIVFVLIPMMMGLVALRDWHYSKGTFEVPEYPNLVTKAVPYFLLLIVLEITFFKKNYRVNDTVNSISMGIFAELIQKIFMRGLSIVPFFLIHRNYALVRWDDRPISWPAWWLMFAGVDLGMLLFQLLFVVTMSN